MKAPVAGSCSTCGGIGFIAKRFGTPICETCRGHGAIKLTPRENQLASALNRLLPVAEYQRPWDALWLKEFAEAIPQAEQALLAAGYQEEPK